MGQKIMGKTVFLAGLLSLFLALSPGMGLSSERNTRTSVYMGSTVISHGGAKSVGNTFGVGWGVSLSESLLFNISGSTSSTSGEVADGAASYPITANTLTGKMGMTHFLGGNDRSIFVPFYTAGLSVISYEILFDYPGSDIGTTSGTAPGAFGGLGIELRMGSNLTFIPQYRVDAHNIRNEAGDSIFLRSDGVLISIRIRA